jgi:hypothetical protein
VRCSSCNFDNAAGKKFCNRCGVALSVRCPKCSSENPREASFCGDCGAGLILQAKAEADEHSHNIIVDQHAAEGELRHLTVLFCDLVGSTEIASHLDPEEWREIVGEYHRAAAQAIERFGGHVTQYLGDGVMAFFGYPEAHDNDAERAVRAGLTILDAISKLNEHPRTQRSRRGSASIQARWWLAWARARKATYSAIRTISPRACKRPPLPARYW